MSRRTIFKLHGKPQVFSPEGYLHSMYYEKEFLTGDQERQGAFTVVGRVNTSYKGCMVRISNPSDSLP